MYTLEQCLALACNVSISNCARKCGHVLEISCHEVFYTICSEPDYLYSLWLGQVEMLLVNVPPDKRT